MRTRQRLGAVFGGALLTAVLLGGAVAGLAPAGASPKLSPRISTVPFAIHIVGNHFVNGAGDTVHLVGADVPSSEYACVGDWGYSSGDDASLAAAIAAWGVNVVRIPLNEDCWLGIDAGETFGSATGYQSAIESFVSELNADGIYAILDLHWSAPGTTLAAEQQPMPDSNSENFWTSVAAAFKSNPAVIFDAFNEPFSPAENYADESSYPVSWSCWRNGGCPVTLMSGSSDPGSDPTTYTAVGMQQLVDDIRATGATQPIMIGGLQFAEDLSQWLMYEPTDTLATPQIAASFHNYEGDGICDDLACWNSTIAPTAEQVPVVTGEFAQDECPGGADDFDESYMSWADQHGVSYLGWGWFLETSLDCDNYYLVNPDGSPAAPNGVALYDHLQALGAPAGLITTSTTSTTSTSTGGSGETSTTPSGTETSPTATTTRTTTTPTPLGVGTRSCVVPRLAGESLARASRRLKAAHCELGKVTKPRHARDLVVAASNPRAGRREHSGSRVALRMRVGRARA